MPLILIHPDGTREERPDIDVELDEESRISQLEVANSKLQLRIKELEACVNTADDALALFQNTCADPFGRRADGGPIVGTYRYVDAARAALTKAKEVTTLW